jgi:hypothetical protein
MKEWEGRERRGVENEGEGERYRTKKKGMKGGGREFGERKGEWKKGNLRLAYLLLVLVFLCRNCGSFVRVLRIASCK